MSAHPTDQRGVELVHRAMPPVAQLGMASMGLIVAGGVYLAANLPHHVSLIPAIVLLIAAVGLAAVNAVLLATMKQPFAWARFFKVAARMLIAYVVIAGMIEYVFVLDHTPGKVLVVMTLMLVVFALDIPTILGFTVARYSDPDGAD